MVGLMLVQVLAAVKRSTSFLKHRKAPCINHWPMLHNTYLEGQQCEAESWMVNCW